MPIVGCYSLDLYCENEEGGKHPNHPEACEYLRVIGQFLGSTHLETVQAARKAGWMIDEYKHTAYCPKGVRERDVIKKEITNVNTTQ